MSNLMELINQKKQAIQANNRGKTVKPPEGTSSWRILPRWDGDLQGAFWHDYGQHFIKDTKGNLKAVYVCTDKTYGQPCQVCDAIQHGIMNSADDAIKKAMEEAKSSSRVLLNAVNLGADKPTAEILELSPGTFAQVLGIISEWGVDEMLTLEGGRVVMIERTGKGLQTKYVAQAGAKKADVAEAIFKQATNLDEYVKQESAEQERRAIANLNAVAGLLSAPSASKPDLASVAAELDALDADGTDAIQGASGTSPAAEPATAAPQVAEQAATAPAASTGDADLDALMKELDGI
ncbi:hypothetical protein [Castellaniella sp.]|uniref:hypothetical protein n=1 Tax=Castellaniella sp. TaxID=1955812 RepID=UPI002AFFB71E|nr:hypothetical protein [Castellaniella sp.]